jgi:hypothetical protein
MMANLPSSKNRTLNTGQKRICTGSLEAVSKEPRKVWCGLWNINFTGTFFFNGTANGKNYLQVLGEYLMP